MEISARESRVLRFAGMVPCETFETKNERRRKIQGKDAAIIIVHRFTIVKAAFLTKKKTGVDIRPLFFDAGIVKEGKREDKKKEPGKPGSQYWFYQK